MDPLMNSVELNCAALHLDPAENLKSIRRKWKHRRSRSTSNLLSHQVAASKITDSDDDGDKDTVIDSDDAERSLAKLSIQSGATPKGFPQSRTAGVLVESDSFNEFFGGSNSQGKSSNGRRRRRHKRIAIDDASSMNEDSMADPIMPPPKEFAQDPKSKLALDDAGKRKRTQREKALVAAAAAALPMPTTSNTAIQYNPRSYVNRPGPAFPGPSTSFQTPDFMNVDLMTMASEIMDEDMKSDDDSSSISSNDDGVHESCDEGREGDDEHSDWVGDEWMEDAGMSEIREFVVLRRFRDRIPSREIRAGKRRVHPNKPPVFSIRTSYNEKLSKFLQNPDERQLTLHPLKKEEINQLSSLASLYSLQLHTVKDDQGLNCHILMKTPHTTQMDEKELKPTPPSPIVSESDTKRVKI